MVKVASVNLTERYGSMTPKSWEELVPSGDLLTSLSDVDVICIQGRKPVYPRSNSVTEDQYRQRFSQFADALMLGFETWLRAAFVSSETDFFSVIIHYGNVTSANYIGGSPYALDCIYPLKDSTFEVVSCYAPNSTVGNKHYWDEINRILKQNRKVIIVGAIVSDPNTIPNTIDEYNQTSHDLDTPHSPLITIDRTHSILFGANRSINDFKYHSYHYDQDPTNFVFIIDV